MHIYQLCVAYDGTKYAGWQQQAECKTVLGAIEDPCRRIFRGTNIHFLGASRTDAGVHALGQVVRCITSLNLAGDDFARILNNSLPTDIHIRKVILAPEDFHPQANVVQKTYYYHIFTQRPLPFVARYGWHYRYPLDVDKLRQALQVFVGTHDFAAFYCAEDKRTDTMRTIDSISVTYMHRWHAYRITVKGHSFLRHMIRRIIGAAVQVASNPHHSVDLIQKALFEKNKQHAYINAPAHGLLLYAIRYMPSHKMMNTL